MKRSLILVFALAGLLLADAPSMARQRMSFFPGHHYRHAASHHRYSRPARHGRHRGTVSNDRRSRGRTNPGGPSAAVPPGFKMEDGVLTYPAPARFQPQNLKHPR